MKDMVEILVVAGLTFMASLATGLLLSVIAAVAYNTFKALV